MRILLIKRGAMGDILMSTPLIRQLKQNIPDISVDFLTSTDCASIIRHNRYLDNVIALDGSIFSLPKIFKLVKYVWQLRGKYDYVFVLDKHYYFAIIARIISKNTIGFRRDRLSRAFLKYQVSYDDVRRYQGMYYLDLLQTSRLTTVDYSNYSLDFYVSDHDKQIAGNILRQYGLIRGEFVVIVNSGGNQSFETSGVRMLPTDKIILLFQELQKNTKIILLGSKLDQINYNNYLKCLPDHSKIINLAGKCSLEQSAVIMGSAKKVFTTDCGAMHLAMSQNIFDKLVCFFGPTCPLHIVPPGIDIKYYWLDEDVFDKNYQLYGDVPHKGKFFTKLDINQVVRENR